MRQHFHFAPAADGGHIGEDLRMNHGRGTNGYVADILQRLDTVLRSLGDHLVLDAVLPVQEIGRGGLKTAAQGDEQAVVDVAIRVTTLGSFGSIDIYVEPGIVKLLLNS